VINPEATVLFLGTGTGEAPHNAMAIELLRKGHVGPIVAAVSVREWNDLGYLGKHLLLEGLLGSEFGIELDPGSDHVFMCGNPAMIGLPEGSGAEAVYPKPEGVVEILERRGFKLDRRNDPGNIHYEEYW